MPNHTHDHGTSLSRQASSILQRGLSELVRMTQGMAFRPVASERYPLPLSLAVYGEVPDPERVRSDVRALLETDPLSLLEPSLVLLELYSCNQPGVAGSAPDDDAFLTQVFASKRMNGWIVLLGDADQEETQSAVNARWQFRFIQAGKTHTSLYTLLNMLVRYAFVYGRVPAGDTHLLGHFIEDVTSGLIVGRGKLDDLELALSLAAMRIGVPAVTPCDYPFQLGRQVRAGSLGEIGEAVASFPSIRRLLDHPGIPALPDHLNPGEGQTRFELGKTWGDTPESFYLLRKGTVEAAGVSVTGTPSDAMGVLLTIDAEPLDAFDRRYIESRAARVFSRMQDVSARHAAGRLVLGIARGFDLPPQRIGESLIAAVRHEFPRIINSHAEVIFDRERLKALAVEVLAERTERKREIAEANEESVAEFITCVGCSAFAPDHVCILTPERPPQCGRAYEFIKTGALYGYDDMTNIHHRELHFGVNSFGTCSKGERLDAAAGEWSGVNQAAAHLTAGRITRVQLHSLEEAPHTGCGCFQLILFKTDLPKPGIGVMERGYKGHAPDGRTWRDLHYALGGKQTAGLAGAAWSYLQSPKFLAAHGGRKSVVWVSPKVAALLPPALGST
jgi:acetyl-CoA decarbonylase/synthase complex subunit beta